MSMSNVPMIKELDTTTERKNISLRVDVEAITLIKMLANIKGDSTNEVVNDILRAFVERNKVALNAFKTAAITTYDNIEW